MFKKKPIKSGNIIIIIAIIAGLLGLFISSATFLKNISKTETYYVLKEDVPAQTLITEDMLQPVSTSAGSEPKNILSKADVLSENYYTKIAFQAGEYGVPVPLTAVQKEGETTSGLQAQIPEDWVVTSFSISSDKAVSGQLLTGDFFDMLVVTDQGTFTPFINTPVLNTTLSSQTVSNPNGGSTYTTETVQYVIGLPADQAARLQHILGTFDNIVLNVSSESAKQCKGINIRDYDSTVQWNGTKDNNMNLEQPFDSIAENPKICDSKKDNTEEKSDSPSSISQETDDNNTSSES